MPCQSPGLPVVDPFVSLSPPTSSSSKEVKYITSLSVPSATRVPLMARIPAPPFFPLMTVPGRIVRVVLAATVTVFSRIYVPSSGDQVISAEIVPETIVTGRGGTGVSTVIIWLTLHTSPLSLPVALTVRVNSPSAESLYRKFLLAVLLAIVVVTGLSLFGLRNSLVDVDVERNSTSIVSDVC